MKLMRLAMCVAIFAVVGGKALSSEEYIDISALQAKLAAQEARLNDLQAKMGSGSKDEGGTAKNITSMRKNAKVTIGGAVDYRYYYRTGKVDSKFQPGIDADGNPSATGATWTNNRSRQVDYKASNFYGDTARVEFKLDVNEHFDGLIRINLYDTHRHDVSGLAQKAWFRWKNICNSGFGVLVGRNDLAYGGIPGKVGILDTWNQDDGPQPISEITGNFASLTGGGEGMFIGGNMRPASTSWGRSRTTQVTPYWESQDGNIKAELSFIQQLDTRNASKGSYYDENGYTWNTRAINYGVGSVTGRLTWKPIEGTTLWVSALNLKSDRPWQIHPRDGRTAGTTAAAWANDRSRWASNNTAVNFGFSYRPCFFKRANIWADFQYDWNAGWVKDLDIWNINYGVGFDVTDQLKWFYQGDFVYAKNGKANVWHKGEGWSTYTGLRYTIPYGVWMEAGWKHEQMTYKSRAGDKHTKYKGDIIYGAVGFDF